MKSFLITSLLFIAYSLLQGQDPFPTQAPIFVDNEVPRIDITISPADLNTLLAPGNELDDEHYMATFRYHTNDITDTVENIGFRLRGNTSRFAAKKSFKISFNTFEAGREWYGLEKLNINGEHNDPSVTRSKLCWDLLRQMGIPAPRANHVRLFVNNEYFGLFANVEHIDEEFVAARFGNKNGNLYKCLYPADLNYLGTNPDAYKVSSNGRRTYDLKTNVAEDDYSDLANFIDILNNTPISDLPCELEKVFNVESYLRVIAFDILAGNWDGPIFNKNNFYLYHNTTTGLFEYIPFDLDNTFGIDWFSIAWSQRNIYNWSPSNMNRPIYDRLMAVPKYRDWFSFYVETFLEEIYTTSDLYPYLDDLRDRIEDEVDNDPLYALDYGFSQQDFWNAFDGDTDYFHTPISLQDFISERAQSASNQLETYDIVPIISQVARNTPNEFQDLLIQARVVDDGSVVQVNFCYELNGSGNVECMPLYDDGQHVDGSAGDDFYGTTIAALGESGTMEYYLEATDNGGAESRWPHCDRKTWTITAGNITLAINEVMASNANTLADEAGEYDDWVELYNYGAEAIDLSGRYLSDDMAEPNKWAFPSVSIGAGEFLLVWADNEVDQGDLHANFKLKAAGEFIGVFDTDAQGNVLIDGLDFGEQGTDEAFGRLPNGTGPFQAVQATPNDSNQPVSIAEINHKNLTFKLFPNPFSEKISIHLDQIDWQPEQLTLVDRLGRALWSGHWPVNSREMHLDLSTLATGVYLLRLHNNHASITKVLVKE